jgi:GAF domain-containing protein
MYLLSDNEKINSVLNDVVNRVNKLAEEQLDHINRLSNIGLALSQERDIDKIFDLIIEEALAYTNADAATIYSVSEDKKHLNFEVMQTKSKKFKAGGSFGPIQLPPVPLYNKKSSPNLSNMASCVYHTKEMLNLDDCYMLLILILQGQLLGINQI